MICTNICLWSIFKTYDFKILIDKNNAIEYNENKIMNNTGYDQPRIFIIRFESWFPERPANAHADNVIPWIVLILSIPNFDWRSVGSVENPPPYPALITHNINGIINGMNDANITLRQDVIKIVIYTQVLFVIKSDAVE